MAVKFGRFVQDKMLFGITASGGFLVVFTETASNF